LRYHIHVEEGPLLLDIDLVGQVPAWRPGTGYLYFGDRDEHYFAWLPSVPQGIVVVDLVLDGVQERLTGVGYHDHNWGDVAMTRLINHWYWGRAQAGAYSIVASYITMKISDWVIDSRVGAVDRARLLLGGARECQPPTPA